MKPRVLMLQTEHSSVGYQRVLMPAKHLIKLGHNITYFPNRLPHETIMSQGFNDPMEWYDKHAKEFDLVVASRTSMVTAVEFLAKMRKYNKKPLVMEFDDHFTEVPKYNTNYHLFQGYATAKTVAKAQLSTADACTVSTEHLKKLYKNKARHITVLPNCIDEEDWTGHRVDPSRENDSTIRIVFAGGIGRYGDLELCRSAVIRIMEEYPTIHLFFMGCFPDWAVKWCKDSRDPHKNRAFNIRAADFTDFRKVLIWGGFDIALAPLESNDFNLGKSNLKYLDYGMANIPGVYSSIDTYGCIRHTDTGMIAHGEHQWYDAIKTLIEHKELREWIAKTTRKDVLAKYNIRDNIHLWETAYESFASLEPNVEAAPWQTQSALQRVGQIKTDPALVTA